MHQVSVTQEAIDQARDLYAPPDHPVFQLVPPSFDQMASTFYAQLGEPAVSRHNVWGIYSCLLDKFYSFDLDAMLPEGIDKAWGYVQEELEDEVIMSDEDLGLKPLLGGDANPVAGGFYYMGGVNNGAGLGE